MQMKLKKNNLLKPPRDVFRVAMGRALARAIRSGESFANRQIRKEYSISRAEVDAGLSSRVDSTTRLKAKISAKGKRLPIVQFLSTGRAGNAFRRGGIAVRVTRQTKILRKGQYGTGAFVGVMPGGHFGVFERTSSKRLPIREIKTLSLADAFRGVKVMAPTEKHTEERLKVELDHQMKFAISQLSKK